MVTAYVPCAECHYVPPEVDRPSFGRAITTAETWHLMTCPKVPTLSPEAESRLQDDLREMDRCRRRAWAAARNYVIG